MLYLPDPFQRLGIRHENHLYSRVSTVDNFQRKIDQRLYLECFIDRFHIAATEMRIHPDPIANGTAEQLIDRHTQDLSFDVPESLLYSRDRTHPDHSQSPERLPIEFLENVLNPGRIFTDDHWRKIFDCSNDRPGFPL